MSLPSRRNIVDVKVTHMLLFIFVIRVSVVERIGIVKARKGCGSLFGDGLYNGRSVGGPRRFPQPKRFMLNEGIHCFLSAVGSLERQVIAKELVLVGDHFRLEDVLVGSQPFGRRGPRLLLYSIASIMASWVLGSSISLLS
jgi:hypothetical protein